MNCRLFNNLDLSKIVLKRGTGTFKITLILQYSTLNREPKTSTANIFDRQAKFLQKERCALSPDVHLYDYLKDEVGYRLSDRVYDIKKKFGRVVDLGCGRGYVSKNLTADSVEKLILCDVSPTQLEQAASPEEGVEVERLVLDEEGPLPFEDNSVDLFISNLSLHWVNDLPGTFLRILNCLVKDGVFLATLFGGDTLYELRCSLQLADLERKGGISPHISPFVKPQELAGLLNACGFTLLTVDVDDISIGYPTMFEVMKDIKGMGESNAARNRTTHLSRETMFAAASIYQNLYGKEDRVPATFQIVYIVGWKPDPSQPKPAQRGSGQFSLKDIDKLEEVVEAAKKDRPNNT